MNLTYQKTTFKKNIPFYPTSPVSHDDLIRDCSKARALVADVHQQDDL